MKLLQLHALGFKAHLKEVRRCHALNLIVLNEERHISEEIWRYKVKELKKKYYKEMAKAMFNLF